MDFFGGDQHAFRITVLAEGVCSDIRIPDTFPYVSVQPFCSRASVVAFVSLVLLCLMLLAEASVRQLWTAGVRTRASGFLGQGVSPPLIHKKSPGGLLPRGSFHPVIFILILSFVLGVFLCLLVSSFKILSIFFKALA